MSKKNQVKMILKKTEVMWVEQHREELNIWLEGKEIKYGMTLCNLAEWQQKYVVRYTYERMHDGP